MTSEAYFDEASLLKMLANDDQHAFELLFNRYKDNLFKVAMLYVKSSSIAEDILQEVFTKVWMHRETLVDIQSFDSWLYKVSKNIILNYNKRQLLEWKVYKNLFSDHSFNESETDHKIRSAQLQVILQKAISQLPSQQRAVYKFAKEENLSHKETAEKLSISPLTVKTHLARALIHIRSYLKTHGEESVLIFISIQQFIFR